MSIKTTHSNFLFNTATNNHTHAHYTCTLSMRLYMHTHTHTHTQKTYKHLCICSIITMGIGNVFNVSIGVVIVAYSIITLKPRNVI